MWIGCCCTKDTRLAARALAIMFHHILILYAYDPIGTWLDFTCQYGTRIMILCCSLVFLRHERARVALPCRTRTQYPVHSLSRAFLELFSDHAKPQVLSSLSFSGRIITLFFAFLVTLLLLLYMTGPLTRTLNLLCRCSISYCDVNFEYCLKWRIQCSTRHQN